MLLDARRTLAADDPLVHRVVAITIDVSHLAIFEMHFDSATASAHIASGGFNLVPIFGAGVDLRLGEDSHAETIANHRLFHYGPYFCHLWSQCLAITLSGTKIVPILQIGLNHARLAYSY